ncbi:hypothetical protein GCM10010129_00840 [Streptomyces fumigatiscleroticus]|nr:hypothetical protein GCM10010129_00840 [Streptomyces fumigatiscleroticus]
MTAMTVELARQDDRHTRIVLGRTCDTAGERAMAERGSTMLLDGLSAFLTAQAGTGTA